MVEKDIGEELLRTYSVSSTERVCSSIWGFSAYLLLLTSSLFPSSSEM